MIFKISVFEIELIAFRMAKELLQWDEPIPDFEKRYPNILESCLSVPFQTYNKRSLYKGLIAQSSVLFYLMIKNHPFENGNKRTAITTLFTFLFANKKWLIADIQELYNFTVWIAQSPAPFKDEAVKAIEKFFKRYINEL